MQNAGQLTELDISNLDTAFLKLVRFKNRPATLAART
ncbi:MAG: hypothetical protein HC812_12905 [Leptolyngbya sp. RL_3_1]|nr:hypothetical protein [Leptolyngbya sp. RL_3_1]